MSKGAGMYRKCKRKCYFICVVETILILYVTFLIVHCNQGLCIEGKLEGQCTFYIGRGKSGKL